MRGSKSFEAAYAIWKCHFLTQIVPGRFGSVPALITEKGLRRSTLVRVMMLLVVLAMGDGIWVDLRPRNENQK